MVIVLIYFALCLIAAAPFGFALSRCLLGRMPHRPRPAVVPEEWARYRMPGQVPAVVRAELVVRQAYPHLAALYDTPTAPDPAHR
ncbi:hypothetical protein ABZ802_31185 [Streptomyces sp. NPDC047737]|uniref:hypothetical protein n=1 Tax=Streptomyces sp. NPDC047737 TaxID=3155740 RepID=UPI0033DDB167